METISVARELIKSNHYLASVNLSHAYFSIPIHEWYRRIVGYINKMGGMASPSLNHLTRKLWAWCLEREIFVVAQHIPGKDNVYADYYSRNFNKRI